MLRNKFDPNDMSHGTARACARWCGSALDAPDARQRAGSMPMDTLACTDLDESYKEVRPSFVVVAARPRATRHRAHVWVCP